MLEADIANDLSRLGVDHGPQAQLIISIKQIDLGLHPFARLGHTNELTLIGDGTWETRTLVV